MFSLPTLSRPLIISLAIVSTIGIASAAYFSFSGTAGTTHILGQFFSDGTTGNAGVVSFSTTGYIAGIDGDRLTGTFFSQTIGLITFNPDAHITPPASERPTDLWSVVGTASSLAGVIDLAGVQYNPVTRSLIWYGMNYGVGRVPFGIAGTTIDPITGLPVTPIDSVTNTTISTGFEWRVKVLGNIGGNSAFDTFYTLGARFNASLMNDTLQKVRRNVALLTRNIPAGYANPLTTSTPQALGNKIIYINTTSAYQTLAYSSIPTSFPSDSVDSLIIVGGDLIIDMDILEPLVKKNPKGIIVLKNDAGVGGNIIVTGSVKKIESSVFTEGSLYSGSSKTDLYNANALAVTTLPENQLYIHGSLISRNTIGWSFTIPPTCVYGETSCDTTLSIRYDLNYFRGQGAVDATTKIRSDSTQRAFRDNSLDTYSLIIELDPRIATTPPPGF
jgi:hypothetical protein